MYHELLRDPRLFGVLPRFDQDLADQDRVAPCARCGGPLHADDFPRKPHGVPAGLRESYSSRLSFTCADCRKRRTPPSVRYFGRRWYVAPVFVLISAMRDGITEKRTAELREHLGASLSVRTLYRWREWWREIFVSTKFWLAARARFAPPVDPQDLPAGLEKRFSGGPFDRVTALLRFLSPLTAPNSAMGA